MRHIIENEEKESEKVIKWRFDLDCNGWPHLWANGKVVAFIDPTGELTLFKGTLLNKLGIPLDVSNL